MRNNILALRLCGSDTNGIFELPELPLCTKKMIENPVAATRIFYRLLENFFAIIVRLPLTNFTGNQRLHIINNENNISKSSPIKAAYAVVEEQAMVIALSRIII